MYVSILLLVIFSRVPDSPRQVCQLTPGVCQLAPLVVVLLQLWRNEPYYLHTFHNFTFKYGVCGRYRRKGVQLAPVSPTCRMILSKVCLRSKVRSKFDGEKQTNKQINKEAYLQIVHVIPTTFTQQRIEQSQWFSKSFLAKGKLLKTN